MSDYRGMDMQRRARVIVTLTAFALVAASCGDENGGTTTAPGATEGTTAPAVTEAPAADVRDRLAQVLEGQVTLFDVVELDMGTVVAQLEEGLVVLPLAAADNSVVEVELPARPVQLREDGLTEGILRTEDGGEERVPLTEEQAFRVGDCGGEESRGCGALTILDERQTMLAAAIFDAELGTTYLEAVDPLLGTAEDPEFPGLHVVYHAVNTLDVDFPADDPTALAEGASAVLAFQLVVTEATSIVLDSDVTFYDASTSTVWSRQLAIFNVVDVIYDVIEPLSTDATPDNATWGLDLTIKGQETWVSGGPTTTDKEDLIDELVDPGYFLITPVDDDELHMFFVGYNVSGVYGKAGGIGSTAAFGGAAGNNHAYSEARTGQTLKTRWVVMAHELGHVIGGTHPNGVLNACATVWIFQFCGASLMPAGSAGAPDTRQPFFSDANDAAIGTVLQSVL